MAQPINVTSGPAEVNYRPYRGDTFARAFRVFVNGAASNVSADTFKLTVKNGVGNTVYQLTIGAGITLGPDTGRVTWKFTNIQMRTFPVGITTYYDIEWTRASDGNVKTLQAGTMICRKDQTPP